MQRSLQPNTHQNSDQLSRKNLQRGDLSFSHPENRFGKGSVARSFSFYFAT
jgi:hypothetical protein